jgi:uncharacterized protein YbjT (DUF2867 family)
MSSQIIAAVGATGAQGSGLVNNILEAGVFGARAITRKPDSEKARALTNAGAEVVAADLDDVDSLERALQGVYGAFFVTNFWEHFSPEKELQQASNLATAAKRAGVQHVVWSTLEDTRKQIPLSDARMPTLLGKYKVPHFDGKGEADAYFLEAGVPTTFYRASFYWENFVYFGMGPRRGEDGSLQLVLPMGDKKLAGIGARDIGRVAYGIFRNPQLIGATVGAAGEHLTGYEMAEKMSAAIGEKVTYVPVSPDVYRSFGFPGADDLGNMFQHHQEFEEPTLAVRSVGFSRAMNPQLQNFDAWLKQNAALIPIPEAAVTA